MALNVRVTPSNVNGKYSEMLSKQYYAVCIIRVVISSRESNVNRGARCDVGTRFGADRFTYALARANRNGKQTGLETLLYALHYCNTLIFAVQ